MLLVPVESIFSLSLMRLIGLIRIIKKGDMGFYCRNDREYREQ